MVSIALCTFNGERFLKEQIDSILAQTYSDFELIICDDGSTDRTIDIISTYKELDSRITLYKNETNLGFVKNFEKAISLCSGDYIALADQDDIWKANKIEILVENIHDNLLIYTDAILVDVDSKTLGKNLIRPKKNLIKGANRNRAFLLTNCVSGNTLMFSSNLVEHILPIPDTVSFHDIWIAFVASTEGAITYVEDALTYYRRYEEQITAGFIQEENTFLKNCKQKKIKYLTEQERIVNDLNIFLDYKGLKDIQTQYIIRSLINHFDHYDSYLFNLKLYNLLIRYQDDIFPIIRKKYMRAFKISCGLKVHIYTCFLV